MKTTLELLNTLKHLQPHEVLSEKDAEGAIHLLSALPDMKFYRLVARHIPAGCAERFEQMFQKCFMVDTTDFLKLRRFLTLTSISPIFSFERMAKTIDISLFSPEPGAGQERIYSLAEQLIGFANKVSGRVDLTFLDDAFFSTMEAFYDKISSAEPGTLSNHLVNWLLLNPGADKTRATTLMNKILANSQGVTISRVDIEVLTLALPDLDKKYLTLDFDGESRIDECTPLQVLFNPDDPTFTEAANNWPALVDAAVPLFRCGQQQQAMKLIDKAYRFSVADIQPGDRNIRVALHAVDMANAMSEFGVLQRYDLSALKEDVVKYPDHWIRKATTATLDPVFFMKNGLESNSAKYRISPILKRSHQFPLPIRHQLASMLWCNFIDIKSDNIDRTNLIEIFELGLQIDPSLSPLATLAIASQVGAIESTAGWQVSESDDRNILFRRDSWLKMNKFPTAIAYHYLECLQSAGVAITNPKMAQRGSASFKRAIEKQQPMAWLLETVYGEAGLQAAGMAMALLPSGFSHKDMFQILAASGLWPVDKPHHELGLVLSCEVHP